MHSADGPFLAEMITQVSENSPCQDVLQQAVTVASLGQIGQLSRRSQVRPIKTSDWHDGRP